MDGAELIAAALQSHELRKVFRGVFARDSFVQLGGDVTGAFLVNKGDRGTKGSHWLSIFIHPTSNNGERKCVFFDSLGKGPPDRYNITIPWTRGSDGEPRLRLLYNAKKYQDDSSVACGKFCIYVLHWLSVGVEFECILNQFSTDNLFENEQRVKDFALTLNNGLLSV